MICAYIVPFRYHFKTSQIRQIRKRYPDITIFESGINSEEQLFKTLLSSVKGGDTVVITMLNVLSPKPEEAFRRYIMLYSRNVNIIVLNSPYFSSDCFQNTLKETLYRQLKASYKSNNRYVRLRLNKEVKRIHRNPDHSLKYRKEALEMIKKQSRCFDGTMTINEVLKYLRDHDMPISRRTYNTYAKQLRQENCITSPE